MQEYKFYMQKCTKDGTPIAGTTKNLEEDFEGLKYSKMVGLNQIGANHNSYSESYAEKNGIRTYVPEKATNKSTTLTLTLYFFGENRQRTYDLFNEYIRHGYTKYWDTARNKSFIFIIEKEIKIASEEWYAGSPYLCVNYSLTNIDGKTKNI